MIEYQHLVKVRVRLLLEWQLDVAADGSPSYIARPPVGGFHDARPATSHDREAGLRQRCSGFTGQRVIRVVFLEPRRTEYGNAGTYKMQGSEAADEFPEDLQSEL